VAAASRDASKSIGIREFYSTSTNTSLCGGATHGFCGHACAVVLARNYERAFVLTTDFREFSAYRVPFASPEGAFHL
jgi:hypothetical protein